MPFQHWSSPLAGRSVSLATRDMLAQLVILLISALLCASQSVHEWKPTGLIACRRNDDCANENHCCSITAALGKRRTNSRGFPPNWDGNVHYCLPWKNENATWCELRMQYSPATPNYRGLCPCAPGLVCTPTQELNEIYYPRDTFGKCTRQ